MCARLDVSSYQQLSNWRRRWQRTLEFMVTQLSPLLTPCDAEAKRTLCAISLWQFHLDRIKRRASVWWWWCCCWWLCCRAVRLWSSVPLCVRVPLFSRFGWSRYWYWLDVYDAVAKMCMCAMSVANCCATVWHWLYCSNWKMGGVFYG